ncbi:MFS transporter [Streptomyces sp. NPDC001292]|uniref:MFS transporter n=1 Tax=Streptomyces sp. NPDC001292 TaxID=3364558 RepID=UPI0036A16E86
MVDRGIGLGLGTDGIRDLWSPFGDGDMLRIALGFARLHGMRTDDDLTTAVHLAPADAKRFVHREDHGLVAGARDDLVLIEAEAVADALVRAPERKLVICGGEAVARDGHVLLRTLPAHILTREVLQVPSASDASSHRPGLRGALASLRGNRPFQWLWLSNVFFFGGVWTQTLVLGWLAFELTHSEFLVAVFTAARLAPMFLGPVAGAFADRHNRVRLLVVACAWATGAGTVVAALATADLLPYWVLVVGGLAIGLAQSPSQPARASVVLELVGQEKLSNANALNAMAMNMTQVIGPGLGGAMIAAMGAPAALWVSTAWYGASLVLLLPLRGSGKVVHDQAQSVRAMVVGGLRIIARGRLAVAVLIVTLAANTLLWPVYQAFMPVFAEVSAPATSRSHRAATGEEATAQLLEAVADDNPGAAAKAIRADANLEARNDQGQTPLVMATKANHVKMARLLLESGADPNAKDKIQDSAFLYAGAEGLNEILELTLEHGADVRSTNRYGGTALIPASEHGHVVTVRILLAAGVPVHVNNLSWTALHEAIVLGNGSQDHVTVVRLLLAAGADPTIPDKHGVLPRDLAARRGYQEIVKEIDRAS